MRRLGLHMFVNDRMISAIIPSVSKFNAVIKVTLASLILITGLSATVAATALSNADGQPGIPNDAIRIRILANSDSLFDQKVKADVRDQVADAIRAWGAMPSTHDDARTLIQSHLTEIDETANSALLKWGVSYSAKVELAQVPFPDKVFDGRSYSAGDYEALRVTLGGGKGTNWWCVLFPPLCLTAATAPSDKAESNSVSNTKHTNASLQLKQSTLKTVTKTSAQTEAASVHKEDAAKPEARFFLWEMLKGFANFLKSLFA